MFFVVISWFLDTCLILKWLNGYEIIKRKLLPFKSTQSSFSLNILCISQESYEKVISTEASGHVSWSSQHRGQGHPHCSRSPPSFTVNCCGFSRKLTWFRPLFSGLFVKTRHSKAPQLLWGWTDHVRQDAASCLETACYPLTGVLLWCSFSSVSVPVSSSSLSPLVMHSFLIFSVHAPSLWTSKFYYPLWTSSIFLTLLSMDLYEKDWVKSSSQRKPLWSTFS